jgi:hypothetical protein
MEDVLDVYQQPYDPRYPQVCFDEGFKQLIGQHRQPLPLSPGKPMRYDYTYFPAGGVNLFMTFEPLQGKRDVLCFNQRTKHEWALWVKHLVDDLYPDALLIHVVMDNLNTHDLSALYLFFPPEEAHRLASKLVIHYTPKHGSWLNMAEIELSILQRQCLDRRIHSRVFLETEVAAWQTTRNQSASTVIWRFTTHHARIKLKHLYPQIRP